MIEHAPFEVVAYCIDGTPTTRADAVVARRPDGWGLAREAMSPGHSLRIVAPADGAEPWMRGPDAVVELRTPGDDRWYPVDRSGEWGREGFANLWAALAAVRARPVLRRGALAQSGRGTTRVEALRALGDDEALVALRFGRRVVVWPVSACDQCLGEGCEACGEEGRVTRGGDRRYWVDGPGAPAELLGAEAAAAAVDVITGTTNTATEAGRAAWGLDMPNRGDGPAAPTVRQREVLSRVGDEFTLAELQESACHRYAGHTRRMAASMEARGAVEDLGGERFRKTALAVPSCARVPEKPAKKAPTASTKPKKARKPRKKTKTRDASPAVKSGPTPQTPAPRASKPVKFGDFDYELDGRDNQKVHLSPDRRTALLRSERAWWVLHRADKLWQIVAGPMKFVAARREAVRVASEGIPPTPVGELRPTPDGIELTDEGRGVIPTADAILRRMLAVASKGDRVDLSPLALAPFVARLSGLEERDADRWWTRVASWTIEGDRRSVTGHEVARAVGIHHSAQFEPPTVERADAFDLEWLKYRLREYGCAKFHRMTGRYYAALCGPDGKDLGVSIRQRPDGWVWSKHRDPESPDHGPFQTAGALLDDMVARLGLARDASPAVESGLGLDGQPEAVRGFVAALPDKGRAFLELVAASGLAMIGAVLSALGIAKPKALREVVAEVKGAAGERGVALPYEATTVDGERGWRWTGWVRDASPAVESGPTPESPAAPTFVLVGCVKQKAAEASAARDLYRGQLWDLRRRYAEARGLPWAIVSGGLGVVGADERVEPYEKRIEDHTPAQRKAWQRQAQATLERLAGRGAVVEVIASRAYVEALAAPAKALGLTLLAPLAGKGIGARKKWLNLRIHELRGDTAPKREKPAKKAKAPSAKAIREQVKGWARSGDKPPHYTAPGKQVRFSQRGSRSGYYRVEQRDGDRWVPVGADHRTYQQAARAALALHTAVPLTSTPAAKARDASPAVKSGPAPQAPLLGPVDVGEPPADVPDTRRLAWMIRQAADALGRPTRGVWLVIGRSVHPIGALPDGIDVNLPTVFVDMNAHGDVDAVEADPGFLLAVEPVTQALRRYRMKLDEGQRTRLLNALRIARGEGLRSTWKHDPTGIRRRFKEGFKRERIIGDREVWTDKSRTMSWVTPKGASNDQVLDAFFAEMARKLAAELPDEVQARAEKVLARAFRMARRQASKSTRPRMARGRTPTSTTKPASTSKRRTSKSASSKSASAATSQASTAKASAKPERPGPPKTPPSQPRPRGELPDGPDVLRGYDHMGHVEWQSSVADFCESNAEAPDLCARVRAMAPNARIAAGGGAVASVEIRRKPCKGWPRAKFGDFAASVPALPGGSKAYTSPDGLVVMFRSSKRRSGSGWYVLRRGAADRVWRVAAGPLKYADARKATFVAQGSVAALPELSPLAPDTDAALDDAGKAVAAKVRALLGAVRGVDLGDEIDLTPLAGFAARVRWRKPQLWQLLNDTGSADDIAKRLGRLADAAYVPPPESADGFDLGWLRRELQRHGCDRLGAVTGGIYGSLCPRWGGKRFDLIVKQHDDGWYWSELGQDGKGRGPWSRAGDLFADVKARLALRPTPKAEPKPKPKPKPKPSKTPSPAETIIGLPEYLALSKSKRPKYLIAVKDAAGLVVHLFTKAGTRDTAHQVARGMLAVSPGMKLLVGKVDPKQKPADFFEHVRALQKVDRLRLDLTEALAGGVKPIGASGPSCPVPDVAADAPPTARTAIRRPKLSRGAQVAVDAGIITAATTVLDFGSGNGDDVCELQAMGIDAVGWDPYREPPGEQRPSDVVLVTNVLNTLYPSVRRQVLTDAIALARQVTVVAVPDYQPAGTPKDDGVVTVTGSFQAALDAEAIEAILPEGVTAERLDPRIVAIRREKAPRRGRTLAERDADQALHDRAHTTIRRYEEAHRAHGIPISAGPKAQRLTNLATNAAQVRASGRKASGGAGRAVEAAIEALEGEIRALEAGSANFELIAHRHTKNDYPIWIAKQRERRAEADFKALKRLAREVAERYGDASDDRPSGYYSRYAKNGAIPGFTFTSEQAAKDFIEAGDRLLGPPKARDASPAVKSGPTPAAQTKPGTARSKRQPYADATRVSKKAAAILEVLTAGMHAGPLGPETVVWRRIGEPGAAVMPLSIDRLGDGHFAVAHNVVQNGDVIADPDVEFFRAAPDRWVPLAIQQPAGYRRYGEAGRLRDGASARSGQRDLARFIGSTWMPNVEAMLLDRGKLPARRAERLHDGTERELGTPKARDASPAVKSGPTPAAPAAPAPRPADETAPVPEMIYGSPPFDGPAPAIPTHAHRVETMSEVNKARRLKVLSPDGSQWTLTATSERDEFDGVIFRDQAGQRWTTALVVNLVNMGWYSAFVDNTVPFRPRAEARDALPAVESGPKPAAPATPASQPWPEVPDTKAPRTIANLRAVRIAHEAQRSGAKPTAEQRRQMLQYSGWGGLSIDAIRDDWPDGIPLPNSRALVHEYYTPWQVCADIVAVVRGLLGERPAEVLEPSAGIGRFVHAVDFPDWRWTAVELSSLSALILEQTAGPNVEVTNSSFEKWVEGNPGRRFDAVISNPPYGKRGEHIVEDKDKAYRVKAAYQYFVLRGLSLLRPGGVGAFLIPGGFMDGSSTAGLRARVDREADLVAAFRLPSGLFPGARLSLDVVFLRNHGPGASKAPDHPFQVGSYFDDFPHHILGEVKETGRWGASEVIGEYTGLPHFKPRGTQPKASPQPSDDFPDAIRLDAAFVPLVDLHRRVEAAKNHGGKFRPEEVPAVSDAVWRAAVEDVMRSRRPKKDRLALLRQIIEDLRAVAAKAERFRQSQRTEDADDAVMRVRMGRDAVKAGIAAVKAQGRRRQTKITAEQMAPFARLFLEPPLAQLIEQAEWSALAIPRAQADSVRQVAGLGALRVIAVDPTHAHIRLTDPGRAALKIEESEFAQQRSRKAARAIEQRGGTVRLRDKGRIEGRVAGQRFTLAMPKTVNGHTFGYRVSWDGGNRLLDAQPSKPIAAVEEAFAAMGVAQPKPDPAPAGPEPELPPIADRRRRPKAEAHTRALRFASPANRLMEVWHVQGRAIATDNRRLAEVPSDYTGPSQFIDRDGREVPGSWEETPSQIARLLNQVHFTVNPAFHGAFDGKRFRAVVGHRGYTVDPLLRLHDGQLYVESGDAAVSMQRHVGRASGSDMVFGVKQDQIRAALAEVAGSITVRLIAAPQPLTHGGRSVAWTMGPLVIDREDGERHVISGSDLRGHEASVVEIANRPITTGPSVGAADAPAPHSLPAGFTALEMDDGAPEKPATPRASVPKALRSVDMDRALMPLADAITRAAFYIRPDDPILRGIRVGEGRVIASDGGAMIEIVVDDTDPARVIATDGTPLAVDYPEPSELMPVADPLATIDPAPLGALDARLRKLGKSPVELKIDGSQLLLDGQRIRGAKIAPGSVSGTWRFSLHRLRPAVLGAKSGRLLLGPSTAPTIIERDDGQRIFLQCAVDPACEVCPLPTGPEDAPPPAPPRGPSETDLAALLARRLDAYQSADLATQVLLYPELAAAIDAFAEVFGRRLATLDRPLLAERPVEGDAAVRRLLVEHPAGVPLARVANAAALLTHGWRLDGNRLLPRDDYLSGDLWARMARLDAIPDGFKDAVERQRAELDDAIGDVSFPEIADRISLRDGWLPVRAIGAFIGHLRGNNRRVALERREGVIQFVQPEGRRGVTYEALIDDYETSDKMRLVIGYINHDERVFRPKVSKQLGEDLNKKRRAVATRFEQQFKAFLSTKPGLRDRIVAAYRRAHRGFVPRTYTGDPLTLARWGSRITPHPHQNAGARRAVDQRGMVAAYGVGVGKTFTACATVALARQKLGTRRPVILVPNSLVSKWQRDIHAALPDFAVVTIGEKATQGRDGKLRYGPDNKAERELKWERFQAGLYDLALVTPAAFMRTRIDPDEFERLVAGATEIQRSVRLAQRNARGRENPTERQQAVLEQGVRAFLAQMLESTYELDDVRWSQLGVDLLIVDEAQNYKGLHGPETREGSIPRFMGQTQPSKRAWNLDARAREVRSRDGFVVLLSATPAKNSPLELYNLWSYVNGELWRDHGIHDPEAFISRFLQIDPRLVVTATMEVEERPAVTAFKHLDELKAILLRWGEFLQPADIGLEVPEPTPEMVEVEMDPRQEAKYDRYVGQIEAELDKMRQGFKTNKVLGLLARMSLVSVHAELDRGLNYKAAGKGGIDPSSPKFDAIAEYILGNNSCGHIVFLQAIAGHRWLKDTLVKRGIPANRIGVLNAELAKSSDARQRVADRFNAGKLDVVIANSIAYEGLDLQVRTCAIHHADLPWEPATLNQRNGRAVRQGNTLGTVAIRYYFASRSMDGLRFNLIQGKQGWMGALLEGSDAIANPGADLELGPDEVLLLISRTPEKTRAQLDKLRAKAEAKRREDEKARALKLLELGAGQRLEARDASTPVKSGQLRADADVVFDALAKIEPDIWPWAPILAAARAADADEILARADTPPLYPGAWLRWEGDWYEVGRFGWQGTERVVWLRRPGFAKWIAHKVRDVASRTSTENVATSRPEEVKADDWPPAAKRLIERSLSEPYRGWPTTGWAHANPAWLAEAWPRVQVVAEEAIAKLRANAWGDNYGPKETRFPFDLDGAVYIHTRGGAIPPGAELLPPTAEGWARWLQLATGDDFKLTIRSDTSHWWWGRPLRRGMQRTRQNPSRRPLFRWTGHRYPHGSVAQEHDGEAAMQLPAMTPIGSHLVLGIDHAERLVWLEAAKTVTAAKGLQKKVPADIPLVVIVRVENNALGNRRPMARVGGDPVFVRAEHLVDGAGLVIAADGADAITTVIHAPDLDGAYRANQTRVPARVPRTVIGTVRHRYRSAG